MKKLDLFKKKTRLLFSFACYFCIVLVYLIFVIFSIKTIQPVVAVDSSFEVSILLNNIIEQPPKPQKTIENAIDEVLFEENTAKEDEILKKEAEDKKKLEEDRKKKEDAEKKKKDEEERKKRKDAEDKKKKEDALRKKEAEDKKKDEEERKKKEDAEKKKKDEEERKKKEDELRKKEEQTVVVEAVFDTPSLNNPAPKYPIYSKANGEEGEVILMVKISPSGKPIEITVVKSSGFSRLDEASIQAVKMWSFIPGKNKFGGNVESVVKIPFRFKIS